MTKPTQNIVPDKSSNLVAALNQETESMDKTKQSDSKGKKSTQGPTNLSADIVSKLKKATFLDSKAKDKKLNKKRGKKRSDDSDGDDDGAKSVDFDENFSGDEGVGSGDENKVDNSEPFGDEDDGDSEPIVSEDEQDN
mgnify:CR=1 FL=1